MRRARRHADALTGADYELLPPELEANGAAEDLELFLLARMEVRGRDEAVRLHERLEDDRLAAGLARRLVEDEALSGDRVLDGVSCVDHRCSLLCRIDLGAIARLEELRLTALEERIDADLAAGGHREALGELEALVAAHPLRERLAGQLMLALYRSGRQAEALDAYLNTRRVLVEEIGLEPNPALQRLEKAILTQDPGLDPPEAPGAPAQATAPERAILVAPLDARSTDPLLAIASPLASEPARELIVARALEPDEQDELAEATADLRRRREGLLEQGIAARVAAFTSPQPSEDLVRLASEQSVDLVLVDAAAKALERLSASRLGEILRASPADVGLLVAGDSGGSFDPNRPVLVPFGAAQHDWAALELGSWLARASGAPLRLLGALSDSGRPDGRDASRLLADASLLVQQCAGVVAEPLLTAPGPDELLKAAEGAGALVVGLSDRWGAEGLGPVRSRLAQEAPSRILFVRRGVRPGGLAPSNTRTRFTWSMAGSGY